LTATGEYQSSALTSLFIGPAVLWSFGGSLAQPIFAGGRIRSGVKFSEARQQEALLTYRQRIQQAFRGVSDGLVEYHKNGDSGSTRGNWRSQLKTWRNFLRCAIEAEPPVTWRC